jgi:4'-phosphopantetheinyl transferase EntD
MLQTIASYEERARLRELAAGTPGVSWDRLLFSAKESVYKTWFPLAGRWLDFESADIVIDGPGATFTARLLVPGPLANGSPLTMLRGHWLSSQGLLVTAITVPVGGIQPVSNRCPS